MPTKICQECGKEFTCRSFELTLNRRRYCSYLCRDSAHKKRWVAKKRNKNCEYCSAIFYPKDFTRKFCSRRCYWDYLKGRPTWSKWKTFPNHYMKINKNRFKKSKQMSNFWKRNEELRIRKSKENSGKNHPQWKGGKTFCSGGYVLIYNPSHPKARNNYVQEHRLIAEKKIGRFLEKGEVVHHINGIKTDNRQENIIVMTNIQHIKLHAKLKKEKNII